MLAEMDFSSAGAGKVAEQELKAGRCRLTL